MTLKIRLPLVFIGYTALVVSLFGGAYFFLERRAALQEQLAQQRKSAEATASVCRALFLSANAVVAVHYIAALKNDPAVAWAACVDARGRFQAHSEPRFIGTAAPASSGAPAAWSLPVFIGDDEVGRAQVAYDAAVLENRVRQKLWTTLRQLAAVAGGTFLLAVLLALGLAASIARPIGRLAQAARAIGGGRLETQAPVGVRGDELDTLALEMNAMARQLKRLDELKDQFISTVSHDLRSPMAAIILNADFMLHKDEKKDGVLPHHREMLGLIMESAAKLSVYVSNILDAAKMKAGRMEYRARPVALDRAVGNVLSLFEIMAQNRSISLKADIPAGLPAVRADPERLEQVLSNLVSNALKFTPAGGKVVLSARSADGAVELCVADTGKGIAPEDLPKLFTRFGQIETDARGAQRIAGTGLGLFIVQQTMSAMGGAVRVESELKRGSRFTLRLPA